jgi:4-amino-4-deoxy-L-arabinose transferase-like glycosyltransferase
MSPSVYRIGVFAVLVIAALLAFSSALQESQTHDEAVHLTSGYSYWKTGDFRLSPEHPPLSKLLASLPLLLLNPDFAPLPEQWQRADPWPISRDFLYSNRINADRILLAGRAMVMLMYLALAAALAWWVARMAGHAASLAALILFAFEPTVLAHSRYVTTDIPVTLFIWLAWMGWYAYLERGTNWLLVGTGVLTGLAFATKYNALFLPLAFALTWSRASLDGCALSGLHSLRSSKPQWWKIPILVGVALLVALSTYGFNAQSVAEDPTLISQLQNRTPTDDLAQSAMYLRVPGYYFLRGIHMLIRHELGGHSNYFIGEITSRGTWLYFPVAFLIKSSMAWLSILFLAVTIAVLAKMKRPLRMLAVPAGVYFGFTMMSSFNIGVRHLLPIYPFLCAFAGIVVFETSRKVWVKAVGSVLIVLFLAESVTAYPHYLSFFNAAAGGPDNGHRYLSDSNLDWGQDLKRLKQYLETRGIGQICLSYFGTAEPAFYGIQHQPLPHLKRVEDLSQLDCVVAISVQHLYATKGLPFAALQGLKPTDRVGGSILIYDLRR